MALLAADLVDEARDFHPAFNPKAHPNKGVLRQLSRIERRLMGVLAEQAEDRVAQWLEITLEALALALPTEGGIPLPEYIKVLDAYASPRGFGPREKIEIVSERQTMGALMYFPMVRITGGKLYPITTRGPRGWGGGWEHLGGLHLRYIPIPPLLQTLEQRLVIPDLAHQALVDNLAVWLAGRATVQITNADPQGAEAAMLRAADLTVQTWTVREVE